MKNIKLLIIGLIFNCSLYSHNVDCPEITLKEWTFEGKTFQGSFLMYRNDTVFIENANHEIVSFPLSKFSVADREFLDKKIKELSTLNKKVHFQKAININNTQPGFNQFVVISILLLSLGAFIAFRKRKGKQKFVIPTLVVGFTSFLLSFTDPNLIRSAFLPFAPFVNTFWDSNYFYVESKGVPTNHPMMVGISNHGWQQQVPIPQCYIGSNAWSIPLNPVMAANPILVDQDHFTRGAIAVAVNGVPIFNPYTNTGVDAYLDGQLDNYGGHSGRGDDYHYHTAPLHLSDQTSSTLPIAYAFDGFAVYGVLEPDGAAMTELDDNHGHSYNGEYHYHGTSTAPYMIAKMAGQVTEDSTHQLIPQAAAQPVRNENWTPLNGALITSCVPNSSNNGYNISYTLNGVSGYATNYSWTGATYTFNYVTPSGTTQKNYNSFLQCDVPISVNDENSPENVLVYPNPFSGKINLKNANKNEVYNLINSLGQIVFSGKNIEQQDFSNLAAGVYFLKIIGRNSTYLLMKERQ